MAKEQPLLRGSWWAVGCSFYFLAIFHLSILFAIAFYCNREGTLFQRRLESFSSAQNHGVLHSNCNYSVQSHEVIDSNCNVQNHGVIDSNCNFPSVQNHGVLDSNSNFSVQNHGVLDSNSNFSFVQNHGVVDSNSNFSVQNHGVLDSNSNFLSSVQNHGVLDSNCNFSVQNHGVLDSNCTFSSVQNHGVLDSNSDFSVPNHGVLDSNCNLFSGTWVYDNKSLPLYKDWNCSFMIDDLACEKYGRKDLNYQYWRWQPDNCDLPKFGAKSLLDKLRDKRLVFVGDSLNRNQWVSLICLVESSIPWTLKSWRQEGNLYRFNAKEYNATIELYWAPLLVESNADDPANHSHLGSQAVRVKSIAKHAKHWADADILIFNSYLWWKVATTMKVSQESLENPNAVYKQMKSRMCYKMALKTWSRWVLRNVDRKKTRLFWMSMSPPHTRASNWGRPDDELKCYNETQPITKEQLRGRESDPEMMRLTERVVESLKVRGVRIDLLSITGLSEYRKDGHPSVYRKLWRPLTQQQLANPLSYADCTHWCLPGVPDVWNHVLYAYLVYK